jgi:hypothetical protein
MVPPTTVYKPPSKWTVVTAFAIALALHAGAIIWVEAQSKKPPVELASASEQP